MLRFGDRFPSWMPPLVLALYAIWALLLVAESQWNHEWDGAIYLLLARSLAEGEGYRYLGAPFFLRPPGLPWLLSFGVSSEVPNFALLNKIFVAFGVAAVCGIYFSLTRDYGRGWALVVALVTGTTVAFVGYFNWVLCDLLFIALLLPAATLFDRGARGSLRSEILGGLLLTGAIFLRTTGLVMVPGILLLYALNARGWRRFRGLLPVVLILLATAPWIDYARSAAQVAKTPSEQLYLFDYATAIFHTDPGAPDSPYVSLAGWATRIKTNTRHNVADLSEAMTGTRHSGVIAVLIALCGAGFVLSVLRRPSLREWFFASYLGVLLIYFTNDLRLVVPLLPFAYAYVLVSLANLARIASERGVAPRRLVRVALILCFGLALARNVVGLATTQPARDRGQFLHRAGEVWDDVERAGAWLRENTPENARVMTGQAATLAVFSDRRVYSPVFVRHPHLIDRERIDYAVVFSLISGAKRQRLMDRAIRTIRLPSSTSGHSIEIYQLTRDKGAQRRGRGPTREDDPG